MKHLIFKVLILFSLLLSIDSQAFASTFTTAPNVCCFYSYSLTPSSLNNHSIRYTKDNPKFWTDSNIKILSDSEQKQLLFLNEKIESGLKLTLEEKKQIWSFKDKVAKAKLGDERFSDFKLLLDKKINNIKLSQSEIDKIKSYFYEIKGE